MFNTDYEKHKLKLHIDSYGDTFVFKRKILNEYKEKQDDNFNIIKSLEGIYHEQSNNYLSLKTSDSGNVKSKKQPMVICLYEDIGDIKENDIVVINDNTFQVSDIINLNELNIVANICLEQQV